MHLPRSQFLLDTHIIIWMLLEPERLDQTVYNTIKNPENILKYSMVSIWELAIKSSLGKLDIGADWQQSFQAELKLNRIPSLPMTWQHTHQVAQLPMIHRDPFDRMLIAQAMVDDLILITADTIIPKYAIKHLFNRQQPPNLA